MSCESSPSLINSDVTATDNNHPFSYVIVEVFRKHLDHYSLMLLSITSQKLRQTFTTNQVLAIKWLIENSPDHRGKLFDRKFEINNILSESYIQSLIADAIMIRFNIPIVDEDSIQIDMMKIDVLSSIIMAFLHPEPLAFLEYIELYGRPEYIDMSQVESIICVAYYLELCGLIEECNCLLSMYAESDHFIKYEGDFFPGRYDYDDIRDECLNPTETLHDALNDLFYVTMCMVY